MSSPEATPDHKDIGSALLGFQADAPKLQKDKINPAFKSKYVTLDKLVADVTPTMTKHGLVFVAKPATNAAGEPVLQYALHHVSGGKVEGEMLLLPVKRDPQAQGSAITYARRYSMMAVLGLVADEDDDGNAASGRTGERRKAASPRPKPTSALLAATKAELKRAAHRHGTERVALALAAAGAENSRSATEEQAQTALKSLEED